jgi:hypothetical protein
MAEPTSPFCELRAFRAELHACLTRRADALFDLCDALRERGDCSPSGRTDGAYDRSLWRC